MPRMVRPSISNFRHAPLASPKLLDFGLARETSDAAATVRYLSAEVLSGRPADEADDVWSLCIRLRGTASTRSLIAFGVSVSVGPPWRRRVQTRRQP